MAPSAEGKSRKVSSLTPQEVQRMRRQPAQLRLEDLLDELALVQRCLGSSKNSLMEEIKFLRDENRQLQSRLKTIRRVALNELSEERRLAPTYANRTPNLSRVGGQSSLICRYHSLRDGRRHPQTRVDDLVLSPPITTYLPHKAQALHHLALSVDEVGALRDRRSQKQDKEVSGLNPHSEAVCGVTTPDITSQIVQTPICRKERMVILGPYLVSVLKPAFFALALRLTFLTEADQNPHKVSQESQDQISAPLTAVAPKLSSEITKQQADCPSSIESVLVKHTTATCPLDQILLDFIGFRRAMAAQAADVEAVTGPAQPFVQAFVQRDNMIGLHPTCRVLTDVLLKFEHVNLPEKIAFMFVMFRTMRWWQISPTEENYKRMPQWLRPTTIQITVPHAPWIDNIPWPQIRDLLIQHPDKYTYSSFADLYSPHVVVNWPFNPMGAVCETKHGLVIHPNFEKHIRNLDNWTVSSRFKERLPEVTAIIDERS
ncbi:uncharacterized protein N7477_007034 [Penicillium maclennaniae]|uniref:uncharacterized protein n=1 Tax=Penicillium maclennaniae TaxID=1343394 RepID=UPI00254233B8|nr:uncharacterized protein N7477_007034 [Penicillium maclennaniae]KAJ5668464.1 hypothetical protein N7477_007034 [Penicillium maclennaniae]